MIWVYSEFDKPSLDKKVASTFIVLATLPNIVFELSKNGLGIFYPFLLRKLI
jgi:hypothetical protein